jgi:hypothetical protein
MNNFRKHSLSLSTRLAVVIAMTAVLTTAALARTPDATFDRTLQVSGPVDLEVLTRSGDVTVRAGSSGSIVIHGKVFVSEHWNILPGFSIGNRKAAADQVAQNPPIKQNGNSVHIDYINAHDIAVDYEITVPADTTIRTHSGSGDQTFEGTRGNVDVQTGSGDVRLDNLTGEIRLQTGSGDVRGREVSGAVRGGTGSGDVEIEETGAGDVDLHTGSGNIKAHGIQGAFHGETGSGDITAEGAQTGAWEIRTGSGNVHVRLPGSAAFDADITTSSGTIDIDSPIEMTVQGRVQETRRQIRGKVRGGGPLLSVHTGSGDIHIQ